MTKETYNEATKIQSELNTVEASIKNLLSFKAKLGALYMDSMDEDSEIEPESIAYEKFREMIDEGIITGVDGGFKIRNERNSLSLNLDLSNIHLPKILEAILEEYTAQQKLLNLKFDKL